MKVRPGILDGVEFPARLEAHVVEPTPDPRIHGYAVQADLARHFGAVDVAWLALTGELPREAEREALNVALIWLAPLHVGEGPAHAGVLARVAGAPDSAVPGVVAVALGQHIAAELHALAPMFAWLSGERPDPPPIAILPEPSDTYRDLPEPAHRDPIASRPTTAAQHTTYRDLPEPEPAHRLDPRPTTAAQHTAYRDLPEPEPAHHPRPTTAAQHTAYRDLAESSARWFGAARALPAAPALTRVAAAYAILHRLGVTDAPRLHALATWARLPVILAEAACTASGGVQRYPADLPPYRYIEDT